MSTTPISPPYSLQRIVVVGASLAGLRACETLRQEGFAGEITLVGDEAEMPYDRPPLSKAFLAGEWDADRIRLRKPDAFESLDLRLRLGVRAAALNSGERTVELADGTTLPYDGLVIATGASPRRLPDQPAATGVLAMRTLADSVELRRLLTLQRDRPARLVVIGAGFIGLEVAATARGLGAEVTVLEGADAPLIRGLGAEMGTAVVAMHAAHGVDVRCAVQVTAIETDGAAAPTASGVRLGDGTVLPADVVVVGVGVSPAVDWLAHSGLTLRDGIVCDATLNAGIPGVYAAGDVARWPNATFSGHDDEEMRVEHWTNASEQGAAAAANLLRWARGETPEPFRTVPFFWSDQYDQRIQFIGRAHGGDDIRVIAGTPGDGPFAALYGWQGRLRGALGVSMPKLVMRFRPLVAEQASWEAALARAAELTSS